MTSRERSARARERYILVYKPYGVVSQFTPEGSHETLASLGNLPPDVYPAGRLDADSEGLLLLTNDGDLVHRLTDPRFAHPRTYLAEVEGIPDEDDLSQLSEGLVIKGQPTRRVEAALLAEVPELPPRPVPVRFRKHIPTSWVRITLREGRNRQVRRMLAAVGHPVLRLVRVAIGPLTLEGLLPGEVRALSAEERQLLRASVGVESRGGGKK